ncbi:MAG: glycosyltransferase [Kiritimatiellae bacterium]|nr:glycosyltransferase [Kiritimatiellia bacterium]
MSGKHRMIQLLAGFADGDAISSESRALHDQFRTMGLDSLLFAADGHITPALASVCRPLSEYREQEGDIVLHHFGIDSPASEVFLRAKGRKILKYHNITPAHFFRGYDDGLVARLDRARAQLREVGLRADAVWADSAFNAAELHELSVDHAKVLPLVFAPGDFDAAPDPRILGMFDVPMTNFFFVGRIAPNKCIEDLILAFAWYRKTIDRYSRLIVAGSKRSCPRYYAMLRMLAAELQLENVFLEGFASREGLAAYHRVAHVFVCASRHEGYCLPLVEAMWHGVPVIARDVGGVPESTGSAGVLYDDASPGELAGLMHAVATDAALRQRILEAQARRVEEVKRRSTGAELRALLSEAVPDLTLDS